MKIFVVEDDPVYAEILTYKLLQNPDNEIEKFNSGSGLLDQLYRNPSVITLDYKLPDITGEELLHKIKARKPDIPVVIISSQGKVTTAINMLRNGAYDYIVKDDEAPERLWNIIRNIRENLNLKKEVEFLRREVGEKYDFKTRMIGESAEIQKIIDLMKKAVKADINVSIFGETGTGKEVVAKAIHFNSVRRKNNFVAVNVAAIPKDLLESELFGHEKGAFTGAISRRIGKFEEADGGTIFLDEIGEMELSLQAKLLRVLQENEVTRIGGNTVTKLNVRIITATHKNLAEEVSNGNFRKDLYYRLMGLPIHLPPLRDRGNDIIVLATFFLSKFVRENDLKPIVLGESAVRKLMNYNYPGNLRELKSVIDLAAVMCNGVEITENDIAFNKIDQTTDFFIEEDTLRGYTKKIIAHYLKKYDNNVVLVAKKLAIGKSTIYQMLKNNEI